MILFCTMVSAVVLGQNFPTEREFCGDAETQLTPRGGLSNCCEIRTDPGCDDPSCEALVCAEFPACCDVAWGHELPFPPSPACVDLAVELCRPLCDGIADDCDQSGQGECCAPKDTPYCEGGTDCCHSICLGTPGDPLDPPDSWCCLMEWDQLCVNQAIDNPVCDCPSEPMDCCIDNENYPGCLDPVCEACVCAIDSFCCEFGWVPSCPEIAKFDCQAECGCEVEIPPCPDSQNHCCFPGFDEPGCQDVECCDAVCADDPYCCETAWDFTCSDEANLICDVCISGPHCDGDVNKDEVVDPLDSGYVLARFNCTVQQGNPDCNAADANRDGIVDPLDVGYVLSRFGECP